LRVTRGSWAGRHYIDMRDMSWSSLVRSLETARALVTGRHHGVYAACVAEIPFVALPGNTHKIEGLKAMSGFPLPIVTSLRDAGEALKWSLKNRAMFREFFHWMRTQPVWEL
jgi:hypothetical protein